MIARFSPVPRRTSFGLFADEVTRTSVDGNVLVQEAGPEAPAGRRFTRDLAVNSIQSR